MKTKEEINDALHDAYCKFEFAEKIRLDGLQNLEVHVSSIRLADLDSIIDICEGMEVMGLGGAFGIGFESGYKKAISDIITSLQELKKSV